MEHYTPQGKYLFNLDPIRDIFREDNKRTAIAGPHKQDPCKIVRGSP